MCRHQSTLQCTHVTSKMRMDDLDGRLSRMSEQRRLECIWHAATFLRWQHMGDLCFFASLLPCEAMLEVFNHKFIGMHPVQEKQEKACDFIIFLKSQA